MKKLFYLAAFASVALVSCAENELAPQANELQPIGFASPVVTPNSRAQQEVGPSFSTTKDFNVWARYYDNATDTYNAFANGTDYIGKAPATPITAKYDGTAKTWYPMDGANKFYWPKNGSLTFMSYYPTDIASFVTMGANGLTITDYTVSNAVDAVQHDILFSDRIYDQKVDNQITATPYNGIQFNFHHALSAIIFNVKKGGDYTGTTLRLHNIKLNNVASKGTFSQNLEDANGKLTNLPPAEVSGDESTTPAAWAVSVPATYQLKATDDINYVLTTTAYYTSTGSTSEPTYDADGFRNADWILLPQQLNVATPVQLEINYSIQHDGYAELMQVHTQNLTGFWEIGKRYIYNITISLDPITLAPSVDVWVAGAGTDVTP